MGRNVAHFVCKYAYMCSDLLLRAYSSIYIQLYSPVMVQREKIKANEQQK